MTAASNYSEANIINAMLRGVAFPLPAGTYIALHTAEPTDDGNNEVTTAAWPSYERVHAESGGAIGTGWSAANDGQSKNTNQLMFPSMTGAQNMTVTHWSVWDAKTGGNCLLHAELQTARTLLTGDIFAFAVNALVVTQS